MKDIYEMPGHLVRRFQQIAVAIFHAEVGEAGSDMTPVQYAALVTLIKNPGIDQATLAGLIGYDRTTIGGVVDRLVQKNLASREVNGRDRRARSLRITQEGIETVERLEPAVLAAQKIMVRGLSEQEAETLIYLLAKAINDANDLSRAPLRSPGSPDLG
ncbi:MarR family transcriptional regulator [Mesorhizobium sp. CAU 1741]|uniref:MarR family winged helix-turn-helix transcriptional regulator n=1 Tax=Mesorhizobium sp. CAU 1741 TaxID=3140366 RepID=UPI00325BA09F